MSDADTMTKIAKQDWARFDTMTDAAGHAVALAEPDQPARARLKAIAGNPGAVRQALDTAGSSTR